MTQNHQGKAGYKTVSKYRKASHRPYLIQATDSLLSKAARQDSLHPTRNLLLPVLRPPSGIASTTTGSRILA